jgi:site-specific recombinase XerD
VADSTALVSSAHSRYAAKAFELFTEATEDIDELLSHSKADRTLKGYASDWRQFTKWASTKGVDLPAVDGGVVDLGGEAIPPALVMLWVSDSQGDVKASTVTRRMAAIRHFHHKAGLVSPTDHPKVSELVAGFTRKHRSVPSQAEPISGPQLVAMLEDLGTDLHGLRDRALLTLGYFGAFRRSELVSLDVEDLTDHEKGLAVRLRRSKTDQTGEGRTVYIAYQPIEIDPVRSLRVWLKAAGISSGPIFRGVNGQVSESRLSARTVSRVVKAGAERIALDSDKYSAHSLRAGHVSWSSTPEVAAPKVAIRATTGHKTDAMVDHYSRVPSSEAFESSSSAYLARAFERLLNQA